MTLDDINKTIKAFGDDADRAVKAGMDAIEMSGGTFESGKYLPSRAGISKSVQRGCPGI